MEKAKIKKLIHFLYEMGTLKNIRRSHQSAFAKDDADNIASHSFHAAIIGYFLAKALEADCDKILKMCLFHDMEEARSGDQNWINKKYVKVFEEEIRDDQLKELVYADEISELMKEYDERKTLEAKIAKDADLINQIFLLKEYEHKGAKEAENWLKFHDGESEYERMLSTDIAKQIAKETKKQNPHEWWYRSYTNKRR